MGGGDGRIFEVCVSCVLAGLLGCWVAGLRGATHDSVVAQSRHALLVAQLDLHAASAAATHVVGRASKGGGRGSEVRSIVWRAIMTAH